MIVYTHDSASIPDFPNLIIRSEIDDYILNLYLDLGIETIQFPIQVFNNTLSSNNLFVKNIHIANNRNYIA